MAASNGEVISIRSSQEVEGEDVAARGAQEEEPPFGGIADPEGEEGVAGAVPQEELSSSENAALDGMDMDIIDIDAVGLEEAEDKEEGEGEAAAAGDDLIFDDTDEEEASNLKSYLE